MFFIYAILIALIAFAVTRPPAASVVAEWPVFADAPILPSSAKSIRLAEDLVTGPETVIPSSEGGVYCLTSNGYITYFTGSPTSPSDVINVVTTGGRPLGGALSSHESRPGLDVLYVADASKGLLRVNVTQPGLSATIEIVATATGGGGRIDYADDVAIAESGIVYFTSACDMPVSRDPATGDFDTLQKAIHEGMRGAPSGRVLKYDPHTKSVEVIKAGLWFANGIAVSPDGAHLLVCETFAARVIKIDLETGTSEIFSEGKFTGYVDGLAYSEDGRRVYVAVPSPAPPAVAFLSKVKPDWMNAAMRSIILKLPPIVKPVKYGCFVVLDLNGEVIKTWVDEEGARANFVTAISEMKGRLYLGSLHENYVTVVESSELL